MMLDDERADAVVAEQHGHGEADQAAAGDQNRNVAIGHRLTRGPR
jgi:hypothetical protein